MTQSSRYTEQNKVTVVEEMSRSKIGAQGQWGKCQVSRGKFSHRVHRKKAKVTGGNPKVIERIIKVNAQGHRNSQGNRIKQVNSRKMGS